MEGEGESTCVREMRAEEGGQSGIGRNAGKRRGGGSSALATPLWDNK